MRTLRITVAVGLVAAALTGASAAAAAPTVAASPWHVAATLGLGLDDVATSCPTVTACTAVAGGELLTTTDGGGTWSRSTPALPAGVAAVVDLSCPTAGVCVLLARRTDGTSELLTGPGNGPFTAGTAPDGGTATAVDCPGRSHCLVTDGATTWTTRDRGATWRASSLPRIVYSEQQLTCTPGTNHCAVFGNAGLTGIVDVTDDDGRTWTERDPGGFTGLYGMDCPTVTVCVAGGRDASTGVMRRTTDGGVTWHPVGTPGQPYGARSVACATATVCTAFGLTPGDTPFVWSTTNGTTWTGQTVAVVTTSPTPAVDCPAAGHCRAVGGGIGYFTDDGGATWADRSLPAVTRVPRAISCAGPSNCLAVGVDAVQRPLALASTDRGVTWSPRPLPAAAGTPADVDCVAGTSTCVVVGGLAPPGSGRTVIRTAVTTDDGATWRVGRPTAQQSVLRTVSCATSSVCLAGGYDRHSASLLWRTTDGARTWTPITPPSAAGGIDAITCPGATTCVVLLGPGFGSPAVYTTTDLGATWQQRLLPDDPDHRKDYFALDCAATTCVAGGAVSGEGAIAYSADDGVTWHGVLAPAAAQLVGAVSCASATVCAATSFDFAAGGGPVAIGTRDGGASWTVHRLDAGNLTGSDISCPGASRCYVPQLSPFGNPIVVTGKP